jgi:hypothetical protein
MTLLAPQINGALFLGGGDTLWFVPALEPGHWDWRYANPVAAGHPLGETALITLSPETHVRLRAFTHCL